MFVKPCLSVNDLNREASMESIGTWWMWLGFFVFVLAMIALDLLVLGGRKAHKVGLREAAIWSLIWVGMALAFNGLLWWWLDTTQGPEVAGEKGLEFLTGYLIEKSLAVDNVFVWLMLFSAFGIPAELQRRVLLYGVLGAIVMRTVMILAGAWLIAEFHWLLYLFGAFLVFTGVRMFLHAGETLDFENNGLLKWMRRHLRLTPELHGEQFWVMRDGLRYATPLFLVLVLVEFTDLIFAVDSIPAIFAITTDPFIVLTSNVFAILGLRAMYFLLADVAQRFTLLQYGLALVLVFIGIKMLLIDLYKIPVVWSLGTVALLIVGSVALSLYRTRAGHEAASP